MLQPNWHLPQHVEMLHKTHSGCRSQNGPKRRIFWAGLKRHGGWISKVLLYLWPLHLQEVWPKFPWNSWTKLGGGSSQKFHNKIQGGGGRFVVKLWEVVHLPWYRWMEKTSCTQHVWNHLNHGIWGYLPYQRMQNFFHQYQWYLYR